MTIATLKHELTQEECKFLAMWERMKNSGKLFYDLPKVSVSKNMVLNRMTLKIEWPEEALVVWTMPRDWYYEEIEPIPGEKNEYTPVELRRLESMMKSRQVAMEAIEAGWSDKDDLEFFFTAYRLHRKAVSGSGERDVYDVVLFETEEDFEKWHDHQPHSYHVEKSVRGKSGRFLETYGHVYLVQPKGVTAPTYHYYLWTK